jgi:AraC-like DNA-binding protein
VADLAGQLNPRIMVQRRALMKGDWSIVFRASDSMTFHLLERGSGWATVAGQAPAQVSTGDAVVVAAGVDLHVTSELGLAPHLVVKPSEWSLGVGVVDRLTQGDPEAILTCGRIDFNSGITHALLRSLSPILVLAGATSSPTNQPHTQAKSPTNNVEQLLATIAEEVTTSAAGWQTVIHHLSSTVVIRLLRAWLEATPSSTYLRALADPRLKQAIAAIHQHPEQPHSVASLAGVSAMSRSRFAAQFSELVGVPPQTYLTEWRMLVACHGLRSHGWSILQAAHATGYRSESAFSRAFTKQVGQPPSRYREAPRAHGPKSPHESGVLDSYRAISTEAVADADKVGAGNPGNRTGSRSGADTVTIT